MIFITLIIDSRTELATVEAALAVSDVWLVETDENCKVSGAIWARSADFPFSLSTFRVAPHLNAEGILLLALALIDDHHNQYTDRGDWGQLRVVGLPLIKLSEEFFSENELRVTTSRRDGFIIEKVCDGPERI